MQVNHNWTCTTLPRSLLRVRIPSPARKTCATTTRSSKVSCRPVAGRTGIRAHHEPQLSAGEGTSTTSANSLREGRGQRPQAQSGSSTGVKYRGFSVRCRGGRRGGSNAEVWGGIPLPFPGALLASSGVGPMPATCSSTGEQLVYTQQVCVFESRHVDKCPALQLRSSG